MTETHRNSTEKAPKLSHQTLAHRTRHCPEHGDADVISVSSGLADYAFCGACFRACPVCNPR